MKNYVLRFVLPDGINGIDSTMWNFLRVLKLAGVVQIHRDDGEGMCFDVLPPAWVTDTKEWATRLSDNAFTFNAVVAPKVIDSGD